MEKKTKYEIIDIGNTPTLHIDGKQSICPFSPGFLVQVGEVAKSTGIMRAPCSLACPMADMHIGEDNAVTWTIRCSNNNHAIHASFPTPPAKPTVVLAPN